MNNTVYWILFKATYLFKIKWIMVIYVIRFHQQLGTKRPRLWTCTHPRVASPVFVHVFSALGLTSNSL